MAAVVFDDQHPLSVDWEIEIGRGRSQVVGIDEKIYVTSGTMQKEDGKNRVITQTMALDAVTGKQIWSTEQDGWMSEKQENFSGEPVSPQATPLIIGSRLITISFNGQLVCRERLNGKTAWQKDMVNDLGATPVQFGFSSSPVVDPDVPERVYVLAAGKDGGFYCLQVQDGDVVWKSACETFSYATPVLASLGGVKQWIVVTENEILGIAESDGKRLWRHELTETGLTNVPTPLVIDDSRLIISGQGCNGTRCLAVIRQSADWRIEERWYAPKLQFFYTNWLKLSDQIVVGCTDKYMSAIDIDDGTVLGRWRGFGDGNSLLVNGNLLVLDGRGNLNVMELERSPNQQVVGLAAKQKFKILDARCWTPISVVAERMFIRGGDRLVCLSSDTTGKQMAFENLLTEPKPFPFERAAASVGDPLEAIFATFEAEGLDAALAKYSDLRSRNQLNEAARIALVESAMKQDLADVAKRFITDALRDFPDSKEIQTAAKAILDK
jgi:outer membrane protein assembly factor BamB